MAAATLLAGTPFRQRALSSPQRGERVFGRPTIRAVPKSTGDRWMGVPEAAEYLGIMPRTPYRHIDLGEIPAFRSGAGLRIRKEDVDAFLEAHRIQPDELGHLYPPGMGQEDEGDE